MQRQSVELQSSFVLHTRKYRETSLIVELFTRNFGRVGIVARGARSRRSVGNALLQPFSPVCASWVTRGELGTLTAVERDATLHSLRGRALACGFYLNELLVRLLTRHDPHPLLFECYATTLKRIADQAQQASALRLFEKKLLEEIGYGLILDHDVGSGASIQAHIRYDYHLEQGPVAAKENDDRGINVGGGTLIALDSEQPMDPEQLKEARLLLQRALTRYLGDKPLKSRELLRTC